MKVYDGLDAVSTPIAHSSVAIGTFDGIHVGHQAIIRGAVEDARANGRSAVVFTLDRHPSEYLAPGRSPAYITTPEQRTKLIDDLGADVLVIARFDESLASKLPAEFVVDVLKRILGAESIVVGSNFCFGKGRTGDVSWLEQNQAVFGYTVRALEPVMVGDRPASSTRIRERLAAGDIAEAEQVLGHAFILEGRVVSGQRLGRKLGYPTANLELTNRQVVPGDGVYAVRAFLDGQILGGACSIGNRPTIDGAGRSIETYLFDFDRDVYGRTMGLQFVKRLRDEMRFSSLDELTSQIARDVADARAILGC